jgi:hypothetical protein
MGTVHPMVTFLAMWTALSVVLVVGWSVLQDRRRTGMAQVIRTPRSHVRLIDGAQLAPVIDLDAARRRSYRRSA